MECKVPQKPKARLYRARINRNILECKAFKGEKMAKVTFVLIETYWNVKKRRKTETGRLSNRINRNILECKENRRVGNLPSVSQY